jgi:hypothetical protein
MPVPSLTGSRIKKSNFDSLENQGHNIWNGWNNRSFGENSVNHLMLNSCTTNNPSMTYTMASALDFKG